MGKNPDHPHNNGLMDLLKAFLAGGERITLLLAGGHRATGVVKELDCDLVTLADRVHVVSVATTAIVAVRTG